MKIVFLTETFSAKMGYIQNALPKALARCGANVHVISEDLHPLFQLPESQRMYGEFARGMDLKPGNVESIDGFTLHVLGHNKVLGYMRMRGLLNKLGALRPEVVQTIMAIGWIPLEAAIGQLRFGYKLFTGSHTTVSVFPLAQRKSSPWEPARVGALVTRAIPGRLVSLVTERCYGATVDCGEVAVRFFGVQARKMDVCPLGVDTDAFRPICSSADGEARMALRGKLGFADHEIVCIYSGRFTDAKDPLILAQSVQRLRERGLPFRGLFLGGGPQEEAIKRFDGCVALPFVPFTELSRFFRASDIGVWPREESMSMLDAAASGIPIIVNSTLRALERIDGNGLMYERGNVADMVRVLAELQDEGRRRMLGSRGAEKMRTELSWDAIAKRRLKDYEDALRGV